ncbi:hypothetical protein [Bdellovibrio svalbardensis]|uniref:Lipoprotein n=1 Tax=Bdellovibrio svalbardensis TaxID=2972972 RepID=A0ABT6DKY5_9BACT|nr:hypothetical protein [Bdellovibrio svalbardensis]MDG0817515.1 hypothetical protein [Bdellovibrio svalbardensis]
MISRKSLITASILITCLMAVATSALADEQGFSVEAWGQSFKSAVKAKNSQEMLNLLDMKVLEKSALTCVDCSTKEKLQTARKLFAKKQFDQSLELYNQIPKGTDYWFQAVEEKGWNYFRQNDSEKALAQSKTLLSPQFSEVVGTEAYFLQSLTQLKICDYKGIFATHEMFKEKQKGRVVDVQKLASTGMNEAFAKVVAKADLFPLVAKDLGDSFLHLPVLYYKDLELQGQLLKFKVSQKALEVLKAEDGGMLKLQATLDKMNQDSFKKMKARLATLAEDETKENSKIVQKLNLIEVEAIQRIHTDLSLSKDLYSKGKFKDTQEDQLVFMDDGRPWIDELDKFEVSAKACPQGIRRKM